RGWHGIADGRRGGRGLREGGVLRRGQDRQKQAKGQFNDQRTVDSAYPHGPLQNYGSRQRASFLTFRRARLRQSTHKKETGCDKTRRRSKFFYIMGSN